MKQALPVKISKAGSAFAWGGRKEKEKKRRLCKSKAE